MATTIRVGSYNLEEGGLDDDGRDDTRLRRQLDMLGGLNLDLLALQELKCYDARQGWRRSWWRLRQIERALGMRAWPVTSNHDGCHLAWLVRPPIVRVLQTRHDQASPWWHAKCGLRVDIDGAQVDVANVHFAPGSPLKRQMEAEACSLIAQGGRPAILCGDMNAYSITDAPPLPGSPPPPLKERKKHDRGPALELEEQGLRDVGAFFKDATPTVGHRSGPAYRCDRIHTDLPNTALKGYAVVHEDDPASDHRPVMAVLQV